MKSWAEERATYWGRRARRAYRAGRYDDAAELARQAASWALQLLD